MASFYVELDNDQRRELVNSRQRHAAWRNAMAREQGYRGSLVWDESKGQQYLLRSFYDEQGKRRQKSLGRRDERTQEIKLSFDRERQAAIESRKSLDQTMERQAAINRALGLGRVPGIAARIIRLLDRRGLLGHGLRIVGTNALYAYEIACGVHIDASIAATEDIDLLFDARSRLRLVGSPDIASNSLLGLLKLADRSFRRTERRFRAENDQGYMVDLIKPATNPPWQDGRSGIGPQDDIEAAEIEGLVWLENSPAFEQIAIDDRGHPFRMVVPDPRVFAIHKLWVADRESRDALKKNRDRDQALAVAQLTRQFLPHLPFEANELRMLPLAVVEQALKVFDASSG